MKLPKRFALSTLLLLMLIVASVFGYAQWRRKWLNDRISELDKSSPPAISLNEHWFWPTVPTEAAVEFWEGSKGEFVRPAANYSMSNSKLSDGMHYTREEAEEYYGLYRDKLHAIGVKDVRFLFLSPNLGINIIEIDD